jgi:cysteamine dioxygenase
MAGVVRGLARYFNGGGAPRNAVAALHDAVRAATAADGGLSVAGSPACEAVLAAMAAVDAADLGVGPGAWCAAEARSGRRCDVWHVPVAESPEYSICVFLLGPGARIPAHDHPGMTVLSKILQGSLDVASFDILADNGDGTFAAAARRRTVDAPRFSELYAARDNVHEFVAGPEGACVLDVLSPPYDAAGGRDCHYVRVVRADGAAAVLEIYADGAEPDFTCLSAPYGGLDPS